MIDRSKKISALWVAVSCWVIFGVLDAHAQGETSAVPPVDVSTDNLERLRGLLIPHGWRVERDPNGDLLLFSAADQGGVDAATAPTAPDQPVAGYEALRRQLEATGWRVERNAEGNLLLYPAAPPSTPSAQAAVGGPEPALGGFEQLSERLEASGWRVERSPDGSVLLYPSATVAQTVGTEGEEQPTSTDFDRLRSQLEASGWRAERDADGSLLLYPAAAPVAPAAAPLATPAPPAPIATSSSCPGFLLPPGEAAALSLPVDTEHEAARIASAWLRATSAQPVAVGRIRRVLRVHLVSIVDNEPPFTLRNQLVIRNRDGCVVAVN